MEDTWTRQFSSSLWTFFSDNELHFFSRKLIKTFIKEEERYLDPTQNLWSCFLEVDDNILLLGEYFVFISRRTVVHMTNCEVCIGKILFNTSYIRHIMNDNLKALNVHIFHRSKYNMMLSDGLNVGSWIYHYNLARIIEMNSLANM